MVSIIHAHSIDRDAILCFIKQHWRSDHIFVTDSSFFDYELNNSGRPQFILAKDGEEIVGLIGYIQYSPDTADADLFLVLLRVLEAYSSDGIAFKLLKACADLTTRAVHTVGANPKALPLYSLMGFQTGYLDHYYWINPEQRERHISCVRSNNSWKVAKSNNSFEIVDSVAEGEFGQVVQDVNAPKSYFYFSNRYLNHPVFEYKVHAVYKVSGSRRTLLGLGVTRTVEFNGARAVRIIDWIGSDRDFNAFALSAQKLCLGVDAEFVDLYCLGLSKNVISSAGFYQVEPDSEDIIPNYFAPFVKENVSLSYSTARKDNIRLFRGDGDQDRPS